MAFDPYQTITNTIIEALEGDVGKLVMPWHQGGGVPINALTNNRYRGVNILNLWVTAQAKNFTTNTWASYKQWQEKGAQVRKGEKSSFIIFYKEFSYEENDEEKTGRVARASWVFNADQVDDYEAPEQVSHGPIERIQLADEYVVATGANVVLGGSMACYRPSSDTIEMPDEERFFDTEHSSRTEAYYNVLLHELGHFTGHPSRLNRSMNDRFGSPEYALEELIAELTSSFLCADLGICSEPRLDHACYIKNWLKALKNDKKFIFEASARAQEAVRYLDTIPS